MNQSTESLPVPGCTRTSPTHIACKSKLCSVVRSSIHPPCQGTWVAIGHSVVYFARAAHANFAGIKCQHCMYYPLGLLSFDLKHPGYSADYLGSVNHSYKSTLLHVIKHIRFSWICNISFNLRNPLNIQIYVNSAKLHRDVPKSTNMLY